MKTLLDVVNRSQTPEPWSEGDNIPWDDPAFSERMLAEHLSQDHDLASRKTETIERHVEWIFSEVLDSKPARVLDLACGPGLYATRLATKGCECVGIDFSPASIRHAVELATDQPDLSCTFRQADLRDGEFGDEFDLVMLIYGQINVFPRDRAMSILDNALRALTPGGKLLLEVQSFEQIRKGGETPPTWFSASSGLFSSEPHVVLQENFWDADASASTNRWSVIDAKTGDVCSYSLSNEAYSDEELADALFATGFKSVQSFLSLDGNDEITEGDFAVVLAQS